MAKKENTVKAHIIPRSGKAADWTLVNPVLLAGELGVETDTGRFKFGNGANPWNELPYSGESGGGLTKIPVATEDTVGGFKSNPRGDIGAVEILGDGTAEVDTVRYAESAGQASQANRFVTARTIALGGEASGSVAFDGTSNETIPVTLKVPTATEGRIGGIKSAPTGPGNVLVDQEGLARVDSAPKLWTARTIALAGDVTGSTTFDGSKNVAIDAQLAPYVINVTENWLDGTRIPSSGICVVFVETTTTITLPGAPRKGQIIFLKNVTSTAKTTITVGNSAHYINDGKYNKKTSWTFSEGRFFLFIWDQKNLTWQAGYMSGN